MGDRPGTLPPSPAGDGLTGDEEWVAFGPPLAEPEPPRNPRNYRITDADRIGVGSLKRKCQDNLAAIELLRRIEAEGRAATDDEKRVLVRYVGWGGLPQVFDAWNEEWKAQRERLEHLLSPEEKWTPEFGPGSTLGFAWDRWA